METQTQGKWYSHGLTSDDVHPMHKFEATIEDPQFILSNKGKLTLHLPLKYESGSGGSCYLESIKDIETLFIKTDSKETSELEGKVVEAFFDSTIRCISVNPDLYK